MPLVLTDIQKCQGTFNALDAKGNPTTPAGPLAVTLGDPSVLSATVDDATHFTVSALGPLSASVGVQVTDGVASASDTVTVVGSAEASASITFGAPVNQ